MQNPVGPLFHFAKASGVRTACPPVCGRLRVAFEAGQTVLERELPTLRRNLDIARVARVIADLLRRFCLLADMPGRLCPGPEE